MSTAIAAQTTVGQDVLCSMGNGLDNLLAKNTGSCDLEKCPRYSYIAGP